MGFLPLQMLFLTLVIFNGHVISWSVAIPYVLGHFTFSISHQASPLPLGSQPLPQILPPPPLPLPSTFNAGTQPPVGRGGLSSCPHPRHLLPPSCLCPSPDTQTLCWLRPSFLLSFCGCLTMTYHVLATVLSAEIQ